MNENVIAWDFEGVPDQIGVLQPGYYFLTISKIEKKFSEDGLEYLSIQYEEEETGRSVFDNVPIDSQYKPSVRARFKALMGNLAKIAGKDFVPKGQANLDRFLGGRVFCELTIDKKGYNKIPFDGYIKAFEELKRKEPNKTFSTKEEIIGAIKRVFPGSEVILTEAENHAVDPF